MKKERKTKKAIFSLNDRQIVIEKGINR